MIAIVVQRGHRDGIVTVFRTVDFYLRHIDSVMTGVCGNFLSVLFFIGNSSAAEC